MRDGVAEDGELEVLGHAWSSLLKVVILRCLCRLHFAVCAIFHDRRPGAGRDDGIRE